MRKGHYFWADFVPFDGEEKISSVKVAHFQRRGREWKEILLSVTNFRLFYQFPAEPKLKNAEGQVEGYITADHQNVPLVSIQRVEVYYFLYIILITKMYI